jgi:hypothetical protein
MEQGNSGWWWGNFRLKHVQQSVQLVKTAPDQAGVVRYGRDGQLTDKANQGAVKAATAAGKRKALADGGGLRIEVQPGGAGWWRLRYSFDGRENRLSVGTYPAVSLKDVRQRRDDARKLIVAGTDPSDKRKADKVMQAARAEAKALADAGLPGPGTVEQVAREWLATVHGATVSDGHAERTRIRFEQDAFPPGANASPCRGDRTAARRRTAARDGRLCRAPRYPCRAGAVGAAVPAARRAAPNGMGMG